MSQNLSLETLHLDHAAASYDKQVFLGDSIGAQHRWAFDLHPGRVSFNQQLSFKVQIIGTESKDSNTWMWAWANTESQLPEHLVSGSRRLKALGEELAIEALKTDTLELDDYLNGDLFSRIASGVLEAGCYYRGEHEQGVLFLLIDDPAFKRSISNVPLRIARIFPDLISKISLSDQRRAFDAYLRFYNLDAQHDGEMIRGASGKGPVVEAQFDGKNRLVKLEALQT